MSTFMWGITTRKLTEAETERRDRVARDLGGKGCGFVYDGERPEGPCGWFYKPNEGAPWDVSTARQIMHALGLEVGE